MDVASSLASVSAIRQAFLCLVTLGLTAYKWIPDTHVPDNQAITTDYVVVGAGTGGGIVGYRLAEEKDVDVVMIEAGGDPPFETELAGMFIYLTNTEYDWKYKSEDDGYSAQYHRNKVLDLASGKLLGGSSSIHHFYYVRGASKDYDDWAKASGDDSWTYENLLPYFKKGERLEEPEILNSASGHYHGTSGEVGVKRQLTDSAVKYLEAFEEVGHDIVEDVNGNLTKGFTQPLLYISNEKRQGSAEAYLKKAHCSENLHLIKNTLVTKILFDSNKNAIGVECSAADGRKFKVLARKEVIISAGAFNTPKLLKLSGIGPKAELESFGIDVIADLPVGENLQDHLAVILAHGLEKTNDVASPPNPANFPLETFIGMDSVDHLQEHPDYITLNLICRNSPACILQLCSSVFGLHDDVCNQVAAAGNGRELLVTVMNVCRPVSTGSVLLRSADPNDPPKIYTGFLSNNTDLENNIRYIEHFISVTESSYFKSVGGETLLPVLPNCDHLEAKSKDYWRCYVLNMMDTTFHYSSTCPMGAVLDSHLRVHGVGRLRVGDASAMPNIASGNINAAVMVLAEKLADLIKQDNVK